MNKTSFMKKLFLVITGILLSLLLLEAGLRMGGFFYLALQDYRNRLEIKKEGAYRIMCLGESTTANQYPNFLEEALSNRIKGIKFTVIDKGIPGTTTDTILENLYYNIKQNKPDMIVAMMGINDRDEKNDLGEDIFKSSKPLYKKLNIYKLFRYLWMNVVKGFSEYKFSVKSPDAQLYINSGNSFTLKKEYKKAEREYKTAAAINPNHPWAYIGLVHCYEALGKHELADKNYKIAVGLDFPLKEWVYIALGNCYLDNKKFKKAEENYKMAAKTNPEAKWAYFSLGCFYGERGEYGKAEEMYKAIIKLNPKDFMAYTGLVDMYKKRYKKGNKDKSLKLINLIRDSFADEKERPGNDKFTLSIIYGLLEVLYKEIDKNELAAKYFSMARNIRLEYFSLSAKANYKKLAQIAQKEQIKLVCVQYPMLPVDSLKNMLDNSDKAVYVDNEKIFREAVEREGYDVYFNDIFGGYFGHCTDKGNKLLAQNIADAIIKEHFEKQNNE
ncbi:MAG: tetratricopeptide repeat protein [Endomicrobiales bacterium]|nr:tetratricopeptide repeat protein [Endomicrobiales bacterium]